MPAEPQGPIPGSRFVRLVYRFIDRIDPGLHASQLEAKSHEARLQIAQDALTRAQDQVARARDELRQIQAEAVEQISGIERGVLSRNCGRCGHDRKHHPYGRECLLCNNSRMLCAVFKQVPKETGPIPVPPPLANPGPV